MQTGTWRGSVELLCRDGTSLGEAKARLASVPGSDRAVTWRGELHAAIGATSMPWPADEPVRLRFPDGEEFEVLLETGVLERGPVLLQVARIL